MAHPSRPDLLGTDVNDLVDINGREYGPELAAADESGVWVDFHFARPQADEQVPKHT